MRTIKELLTVVRNSIINDKPQLILGLCWYTTLCLHEDIISREEYDILQDYYKKNVPVTYNIMVNKVFNDSTKHIFWWKPGNKTPRIKYLNKHIKKQKV